MDLPRLITSDVAKFCDALAELYGNIGKPALDMYLFSNQLERNLGDRGMGSLWWAYYFTLAVMRAITPNFGKLRETEAKLEVPDARPSVRPSRPDQTRNSLRLRTRALVLGGRDVQGEFRFAHSRLITNAEEIAFYGGHEIERNILDQRYNNLARHANKCVDTRRARVVRTRPSDLDGGLDRCVGRFMVGGCRRIYQTRVWFNMFEDMLLKYAWSTIGLIAQAVPVFWPDAVLLMDATRTMRESDNVAKRTEKYITNRRYARTLASRPPRKPGTKQPPPDPPHRFQPSGAGRRLAARRPDQLDDQPGRRWKPHDVLVQRPCRTGGLHRSDGGNVDRLWRHEGRQLRKGARTARQLWIA